MGRNFLLFMLGCDSNSNGNCLFICLCNKIHVPEWIEGSIFYYWFNNNPFGVPEPFRSFFNPIVSNKYITPLITWGVLVLEALLFGALFMKRKHKQWMFKLAVGFHFMIILIHGLWSFFFAIVGGLVIYLLPSDKFIKLKIWNR